MRAHSNIDSRWSLAFAIAGVLAACGNLTDDELPTGTRSTADDPMASNINASGAGAGTGANTGLPCDVQQLLESRCIGCHLGTSPPPLLTYDDLVKTSGGTTLAQRSLDRMRSTTSPMPPAPAEAPTAEEIGTLDAWIKAGLPKGAACTPSGDAGAPASNVYNTPTVCTSGKTWTGGDRESSLMRPGGACMTCHAVRGGPSYKVAGTVYPSAHEPNDCNGVSDGTRVVVTDAKGVTATLTVNEAGNFYSRQTLAAPFRVKVVRGTAERAMLAPVTAGDCNTCHTTAGVNGAPGRIMAP